MLPSAEAFAAAMVLASARVRGSCITAANPWWATRVWWMLRVFGFDNAAVLNGGWQKWSREGRPVEIGPAKSRAPGHFVVRVQRPLWWQRRGVRGDRQYRGLHDQCTGPGAARRRWWEQLRRLGKNSRAGGCGVQFVA
jgi:3-mercaptopyruvate sulfurtransferase SseA